MPATPRDLLDRFQQAMLDFSPVLRTAAGLGRLTQLFEQVRAESAP
ncbi:hypothetical protein [Microbispora bryophytorum]|uniref:Uncharacterized protein n=1 Tax=Microbispora bryophytorum subsp. camponoti TaxID=1677852 RepID=A0ABR8LF65_9ACTN|nr:hypothetical protein [Microbispora camponoti]MBD3148412.1 hypothetical protein [Microbispora camponoti]